MGKLVHIYAYAEMNFGDDLFVKILCNRYPNTMFQIVSKKSTSRALLEISNLKVYYAIPKIDGFLDLIKAKFKINEIINRRLSKKADIIVNIGGSIFIEDDNWRNNAKIYEKRIISSKPFYIIGSNFGPYTTDAFLEKYRDIFSKVTKICFRDQYSFDMFRELGSRVTLAPDVVFSMKNETTINSSNNSNKSKIVTFSIMNYTKSQSLSEFHLIYVEKMKVLIKNYLEIRFIVNLVSFCNNQGDLVTINEIYNSIENKDNLNIVQYDGNLAEIDELFQNSDFIVSNRFHSLILAMVYGKDFFPIVYSNKTSNLLADIGYDGESIMIKNISEFTVNETLLNANNGTRVDISEYYNRSQFQFEGLDELID